MESNTVVIGKQLGTSSQVLTAAASVLYVAVSYVDPGKWAASVEGGARLGYDMALFVLLMNCIAMLCQYLSARIAISTSKDLAQICREEYDNVICILLGIPTEISMILLDLTMVLGTACGLNAILGIELFNCIFLTGLDAAIFPFLANLIGNPKAKLVSICLASFILVSYFCGVLVTQPESSLSMGGMLNKLTGENVYALMGILGASIMPHNFYLHSSIVQQDQGQPYASKVALCHYQFFAILCIFSAIYLANCVLMNLAANVFYNSGLVPLGLQDALSLLDQVFRSSLGSFALLLFIISSDYVVSLSWCRGREAITQVFFNLEIPGWLHHAAIRIISIVLALCCIWNSGAEGVFQLLVFTQVIVAILLPSSVVPLFRVASCKTIMGSCQVSPMIEVLAFVSFMGMLGLKIVFVMEMIFGSSDWVSGLNGNPGSVVPIPYVILLTFAMASIFVMLLLIITPLRSAHAGVDTQGLRCDDKNASPELSLDGDKAEMSKISFYIEKPTELPETALQLEKSIVDRQDITIPGPVVNLPETLLDSESDLSLTTVEVNNELTCSNFATGDLNQPAISSETPLVGCSEVSKNDLPDSDTLNTETKVVAEKILSMSLDIQNDKNDVMNLWEPEEIGKEVSERNLSSASEGPGSYKCLSGKIDDVASGTGSLSRIAGIGRAARRQLTSILDDFWGQLFNYHGEVTDEAKAKKLDVLIGVDSKISSVSSFSSVKTESPSKQPTGCADSVGGNVSDSFQPSSYFSYLNQQPSQSGIGSLLDVQKNQWVPPKRIQRLDPYRQNSSFDVVDFGERRYFSVHAPSSSSVYDQQPATIHGYELRSYLGQIAKEKGYGLQKNQPDSPPTPSALSNSVNSYGRPSSQKPLGGLRNLTPPGFHNVPAARNNALKSERNWNNLYSSESADHANNSPDVKKFYSLPDISGLYDPQRDSSMFSNSPLPGRSMVYGKSISHLPTHEQIASSWTKTAVGFNDRRDDFSLQFSSNSVGESMWLKQPYQQFGVADNSSSNALDSPPLVMDVEVKLLQSFRSCIMKLVKLEGGDVLFSQNDGIDEDIISRVALREKFLYEVENRAVQIREADQSKWMLIPNCGEGCVWGADLIISFGVWCIHRILDLSLIESRPELWGKYTYVLNRLQGIIDPAFSKLRQPRAPCFCLHLPSTSYQQKSSPPLISTAGLPHPPKPGAGKFTTAAMLLDVVKDVEIAISSRKGKTGTAAGDIAFPKGKENLASVLKRYKRRLSSKTVGSTEVGKKVTVPSSSQGL